MALVFLDKMESPVRCSMELACALRREESYKVRMGIHSGPVFIVEDINGQRNVSGAGINRAQRVMDCGDGDHILLSDTIAESLRQFREWNVALKDIGDCQVKDGWQHVWSFEDGNCGNRVLPKKSKRLLSERRRTVILGLAAFALLAALGAWFLLRPRPVATVVVPPSVKTSISYSLIVAAPDGKILKRAKEIAFPPGYRIKLKFVASEHGFLYLINEGPESSGVRNWSWLFPHPEIRPSAEIERGQTVFLPEKETSYFKFDTKSGAETIFLVWSTTQVPKLEELRSSMFKQSVVNFSAEQTAEVRPLLETNLPAVTSTSDGESTTLSAPASYFVKTIVLDHI